MKLNVKASVKVRCGLGRFVWSLKQSEVWRWKLLSLHNRRLKWTFRPTEWGRSLSIWFKHTNHEETVQVFWGSGGNTGQQFSPQLVLNGGGFHIIDTFEFEAKVPSSVSMAIWSLEAVILLDWTGITPSLPFIFNWVRERSKHNYAEWVETV